VSAQKGLSSRHSRRARRLWRIGVVVALVVACVGLTMFEFWSLRHSLRAHIEVQAQIVADNSEAALVFRDRSAGSDVLSALRASPSVRQAMILDAKRRPFAAFEREPFDRPLPSKAAQFEPYQSATSLAVVRPVMRAGKPIGHVYVLAGLESVYWHLLVYAAVAFVTALLGMAAASLLVSRLRRAVEHAEARLDYLAYYDPVTNLLNRHGFNERIHFSLSRAQRFGGQVGLLLLDLDNFKVINDTMGHQAGDALLSALGYRLREALRQGDTVCRLGGDEFAVIVDNVGSAKEVELVAGKIVKTLEVPLMVSGQEVYVTASCGVSLYPEHGSDAKTLVRTADTAMYCAKEAGKNAFRVFRPEMNQRAFRRMSLEHSLRKAMENGDLRLRYQPKVDLRTGRIVGAEALLRWVHAEDGSISPAEFIPVAEESGLIVPLGAWVLRTACREAKRWEQAGLGRIPVAVNLSARQFKDQGLLAAVLLALEESGLEPGQLELELTESMLMENVEANIELLRELRTRGVRLAIDDFGTGYSSMGYLKRFPIRSLKVDRSFVRDIPHDRDDCAIAGAIVALAHQLELDVVAEGVENVEQLRFLAQHDCHVQQGFYFSPALASDEFERWVREHHGKFRYSAAIPSARAAAQRSGTWNDALERLA
jgi:diguanylate cyclase (GGDEF)-like protein